MNRELNQTYDRVSLDKEMWDIVDDNHNMSIAWYIMASYAYYVEDSPILSDSVFDRLARFILNHYNELEHSHKEFVTEDMLRAGTYLGEYPKRAIQGLEHLRYAYNFYPNKG